MDWYPLINSLRIAAISAVVVFFAGIAAAYYIAKLPRLVKGILGQHRTIRQADSARDFSSSQGLKSEEILYVFRTFQTAELAEKIR